MKANFSPKIMTDMMESVQMALRTNGIVNIPRLAEDIRKRNEAEYIALEDISAQLLVQAQMANGAMEFDGPRHN